MTEAPPPPADEDRGGAVVYAEWSQRAFGSLIDAAMLAGGALLVFLVAAILRLLSDRLGDLVALVGYLAVLALAIRNQIIVQGNTGQSIGKTQVGIKLISEHTGQPLGAGLTLVRQIAHVLDGLFFVGYLWPLRDVKKQTFADKIMTSVVVKT